MPGTPLERTSGARGLLYTVLGEFVLPGGGSAWTSTLVAACELVGVSEKNARQALARLGDQGRIEPRRHGRQVRWHLTASGQALLRAGAERIYAFGTQREEWTGEWLMAHCPVPESRRAVRLKLRTQLAFRGFGELSASLAVSPRVEREAALRAIVADLGLDDVTIWRARTATPADDAALAGRAWDLVALAEEYASFLHDHSAVAPVDEEAAVRATIELVHQWRRFPSIDPELPRELLADNWIGDRAGDVFERNRTEWFERAHRWFTVSEGETA